MISCFPHMHVRGKDMKFTAYYPNGESEVLIDVPEHDFDWQLFYYPDKEVKLPAGTRLDILAHYDNSELNPDNPDPTKDVTFGTQTNDEMMFTVFEFIANEGVSPIPSSDERRLDFLIASLPADSTYNIDLQMMGRAIPSALHLPKTGEGTWYILMQGNLLLLAAKNVEWDGSSYSFDIQMRLGPMGGDFVVKGMLDGSGINGEFEGDGMVPFSACEGQLTGDS